MLNVSGARAYHKQMRDERNSKIEEYAPLVKRIALHLKARLPPSVEIDDLIQSGMLGLMDAIANYEDGHGASFETYAGIRIRGAMIDEMRKLDWAPRSVHSNSRQISKAMVALSNKLGREPKDIEIAEELEISVEKYHQMLTDSVNTQVLGMEDLGVPEDVYAVDGGDVKDDKLFNLLVSEKFKTALADAVAKLPEREQMILALYYDEELNLREIGLILEISEARVCQLMSQAIARLRAKLKDWVV